MTEHVTASGSDGFDDKVVDYWVVVPTSVKQCSNVRRGWMGVSLTAGTYINEWCYN